MAKTAESFCYELINFYLYFTKQLFFPVLAETG